MKRKVELGSVLVTVLAMAVATAAYGVDYYVDANNGDDGWDGTTATIPTAEQIDALTQAGEPIPGPRKTLHAMMSDSRVTVGNTVWAAEGDYNDVADIVVPEGESITLTMAPRAPGRDTRYELVYTPEGGSRTVISEASSEAFSHTLDGACTVQALNGYVGFVVTLR
jgi:hypothetical protein